jgi:sporulation protein YlmC with PRC-barrel domain
LDKALLDNLRHGVDVISSDSKNVGELYAAVVDPRDNQLTHIVVNVGPHFPMPGFGAPDLD